VAGWYEATYGETEEQLAPYFPLLVHHYHHAEDAGQERRYAGLAGNRAAAQYANAEAVRYLSRALELTPEEETIERYDLLSAREKVYNLQGEREPQTQDIAAIQELADTLGDDRRRAAAALRQVYYAEATGDYPAATATVEDAIHLAQAAQDAQAEATGYLRWGVVLWLQGEPDEAQQRLERALVRAREGGQPQVEADSLLNLGNVFCRNRGDYPQARALWEQALGAYRAAGDHLGENKPLNNLGMMYWYQGDLDQAKSYYEQALHICRETGDRRGEARTLYNLGAIADLQGHFSEAQARFEQTLFICHEVNDPLFEGRVIKSLGILARHQGQYDVAQAYFAQSLRICQSLSARRDECFVLSNMSLLARLQGDYESALNHSRQALAIARDLGDRSVENGALLHQGHAFTELGRQDEAVDAYQGGLAIARELKEYNVVIESLAGLARVSMDEGDQVQALAWVDELLDYLAERSLDGTYEPFRVYLTCYQVLDAARDVRARDILTTAYRLLQQQASGIEDEDLRRSFLQNVAAHRAIAQAYEARLSELENSD
jgi:tetratricopeptide (TPR) repeat protein